MQLKINVNGRFRQAAWSPCKTSTNILNHPPDFLEIKWTMFCQQNVGDFDTFPLQCVLHVWKFCLKFWSLYSEIRPLKVLPFRHTRVDKSLSVWEKWGINPVRLNVIMLCVIESSLLLNCWLSVIHSVLRMDLASKYFVLSRINVKVGVCWSHPESQLMNGTLLP